MRDASPGAIAVHYATCSAFALSAAAAPFVPEAILAYAGIQYLRGFLYGSRQWRAPARVPLHLGRRGYRDQTSRKRGAATWPLGQTDTAQVWLQTQDLAQGCAFISDDPTWHARIVEELIVGACLNSIGAVVVEDHRLPSQAPALARQAEAFGRAREFARLDLSSPLETPLRITPEAIGRALATLALPRGALALNAALAPILAAIGARHRKNALPLYAACQSEAALARLASGAYEIDGHRIELASTSLSDAAALHTAFQPLADLPAGDREAARLQLEPFARDLATSSSLSLSDGIDLADLIASRRLAVITPGSPFLAALTLDLCTQALTALPAGEGVDALIHAGNPPGPGIDAEQAFLEAAAKARAIAGLSLPSNLKPGLEDILTGACRLHWMQEPGQANQTTAFNSTLKNCSFTLTLQAPPAIPAPSTAKPKKQRREKPTPSSYLATTKGRESAPRQNRLKLGHVRSH